MVCWKRTLRPSKLNLAMSLSDSSGTSGCHGNLGRDNKYCTRVASRCVTISTHDVSVNSSSIFVLYCSSLLFNFPLQYVNVLFHYMWYKLLDSHNPQILKIVNIYVTSFCMCPKYTHLIFFFVCTTTYKHKHIQEQPHTCNWRLDVVLATCWWCCLCGGTGWSEQLVVVDQHLLLWMDCVPHL